MASEIDLWVVIPLCILGFALWVGFYIYITLTVIRHDPREIKYRKDTGKNLGILPDKLFKDKKS
ncbi:MAG: hypothetical protein ACI8WT_003840 [Clostridium sp.]|jgi:hypothetical protein